MEARLETALGEMRQILLELETVRGQVLSAATSGDAEAERRVAGEVRALRDELSAVDADMETMIAQRSA